MPRESDEFSPEMHVPAEREAVEARISSPSRKEDGEDDKGEEDEKEPRAGLSVERKLSQKLRESSGGRCSEINQERLMTRLANRLAAMALTDEKYLRATPASRVIERAGRALRPGTHVCFEHSRQVKEISKFLSHSWQSSPLWKLVTLQMFYNWKVAALASNLLALLAMIMSSYGFLPPMYERTPRFGEPMMAGVWATSIGMLSFVLVWAFRPPRDMIFLDRICINQADAKQRGEGLVNLGACLRCSKNLLVIWDETYCRRLWCLFEIAAYLKTHEDSTLLVQPLILTQFVVSLFVLNFVLWGLNMVMVYDSVFTIPLYVLGTSAYGWLIARNVLQYSKSFDSINSQLQNIEFEKAECYCCSVDHTGPQGQSFPCDRFCIRRCVQLWFGSVEEFEKSVQTRVKDVLSRQFSDRICPYPLLIITMLPFLWIQLDYAADWFAQGDNSAGVATMIFGVVLPVVNHPILIAPVLRVVRSLPQSCPHILQQILGSAVFVVISLTTQAAYQLSIDSFGLLLGILIFCVSLLIPNALLWRCAMRLY
ncbi:cpr6 [Symbiodinium natans]|uniref:Cpr6 protein n=1 Tax=Symbiodinium natans TaxID=878477 RepID=A0A812N9E0_9DINO|nr:cpr6 [Symbiodinium natans]